MTSRYGLLPLVVAGFLVTVPACRNDSTNSSESPSFAQRDLPEFPTDPSQFVSTIDNPYLPLIPGTVFTYQGETDEGVETIVVEVTAETKTILGITATVVRDRAYLDGELIEDTFDWFAQDVDGNVWYLGEDTKEIVGGNVVSTEGSWEAGVDGALPGIVMLAEPKIGMKYRQEWAEGVAEDHAKVMSLSKTVEVEYGEFENVLETMEWTPLEPGARERKYYALGIGLILEVAHREGGTRIELISVTGPGVAR